MLDQFLSSYKSLEKSFRTFYKFMPKEEQTSFLMLLDNFRTQNSELNNRYNVDGKGTYIPQFSVKTFKKSVTNIDGGISELANRKMRNAKKNETDLEKTFQFYSNWKYIKALSEYLEASCESKQKINYYFKGGKNG